MENHFSLKEKITKQTPNDFTILNKNYNIFHSLLFSLLFISHNFLLLYVFFGSGSSPFQYEMESVQLKAEIDLKSIYGLKSATPFKIHLIEQWVIINISFQHFFCLYGFSLSLSLSSKIHGSSLSPQPSFSLTLPSALLSQPQLRLHQSLHLHACSLPLPQPRCHCFLHSQLKPISKNKEKKVNSNLPAEVPTPHTRTLFRPRSERE